MPRGVFRLLAGAVAGVFAAFSAGAEAWPPRFFAPYVDATAWPPFDFVGAARDEGLRHYTLAFIVAGTGPGGAAVPSWGGYCDPAEGFLTNEIAQLRDLGGDVMVSFGGAAGTELAVAITNIPDLQAACQSVIDAYDLTLVDSDIEGAWVAHDPSIARRSAAVRGLQTAAASAGRELRLWYTLPVLPSGLTADGLNVVRSALTNGVRVDGVNIMAMDYGDSAAPNPDGQMGEYAVQAASNLFAQLKGLYQQAGQPQPDEALWRMIGVTPMIGVNDVQTEVFYPEDAQQLLAFAVQRNAGMLAFWSMRRDQPCPPGQVGTVSPAHSGLLTEPFEFSRILRPFTGDGGPGLYIGNVSVAEGDSGTATASFPVMLAPSATQTVSVGFFTTNGTALAGAGETSVALTNEAGAAVFRIDVRRNP